MIIIKKTRLVTRRYPLTRLSLHAAEMKDAINLHHENKRLDNNKNNEEGTGNSNSN